MHKVLSLIRDNKIKKSVKGYITQMITRLKYEEDRGWRDGSVVKSIACSSKGPEFNSQQPHGGSQPSVMGSGALFWPSGIHTDRILYT